MAGGINYYIYNSYNNIIIYRFSRRIPQERGRFVSVIISSGNTRLQTSEVYIMLELYTRLLINLMYDPSMIQSP